MAPQQTKTSYVLALPSTLAADEVVARAKSDGVTLTAMHVYKIRSLARVRARSVARPAGAPKPAKRASSASPAKPAQTAAARARTEGDDTEFVRLVLAMGVDRATMLVDRVRTRIEGLIARR